MPEFRFKRFSLSNERAAMKVNTDGVLLGACATTAVSDCRVLDVGTGTGCIALMLAQRYFDLGVSALSITGIDIDSASVEEASENFSKSPWASCLESRCVALQKYSPQDKFDLIVSNPPYFRNDLHASESRRDLSRHADVSLSYENLIEFATQYLSDKGRLAVILPAENELSVLRMGLEGSLFASKILRIRTTTTKEWSRIIVEMERERRDKVVETLTLLENGRYTCEYISRVSEFYLFA